MHAPGGKAVDTARRAPYLEGGMPKDDRHPQPRTPPARSGHVCPWWLGPLLASPLRRLIESPEQLLGPHVKPGMTVLEPGCGMGFFTLPLARLVGPAGKVICVDVQPRMIDGLRRRARRAGLLDRIESSVCVADDLGLEKWQERVDQAIAINTVHETGDAARFLEQIAAALRPGGTLLLVEPRGHVSREAFATTLAAAERVGLSEKDRPATRRKLAALLVKTGSSGRLPGPRRRDSERDVERAIAAGPRRQAEEAHESDGEAAPLSPQASEEEETGDKHQRTENQSRRPVESSDVLPDHLGHLPPRGVGRSVVSGQPSRPLGRIPGEKRYGTSPSGPSRPRTALPLAQRLPPGDDPRKSRYAGFRVSSQYG